MKKKTAFPEMIGKMILIDEIHRTFSGKNIKFTVASDFLLISPRFTELYPIQGPVSKEKFVQLLLRVSDDFLFYKK